MMIIYPAIDLRGGKVVRLREGDPKRQIVFSEDPMATAQSWIDQGASWIHMVNLDGAFNSQSGNLGILEEAAKLDVRVQYTGGLRDLTALGRAWDSGASRIVIGTLAVREPTAVAQAVARFGADAICVALDAKDGKVLTHGWTESSARSPLDLGALLYEQGARHALYTDVRRDGGMSGVNVDDTVALARETGLRVIASGGVSQLSEIEELAQTGMVAGVIIGMALYQKRFTLAEALTAARSD
ncbi:MAG: 1-(5-phosphoribosyl)-5-[(5-phosphoribosylamino)methylideneamino] imidazole-4-carboxamide isomerase [Chloroflexota bacterium]|nr:1-(5-phosphoribosyl)-5-[(5-phosphoribosylamino)methylideneamino] imidazole-4-carboxamide isomerase [Chloroflexota bacterium]